MGTADEFCQPELHYYYNENPYARPCSTSGAFYDDELAQTEFDWNSLNPICFTREGSMGDRWGDALHSGGNTAALGMGASALGNLGIRLYRYANGYNTESVPLNQASQQYV